ncbi:Protein PHLOEM PROTEIN 2-LIKE A5 [Cardamine amara subsp. amara]|uniref:Protein PHLOEM PROTEIN 2-LIKE A5 n=1 Tax=Cardamine amara subsp. amara TaxID=228776 RepID=A0ABD1C3E7_CARAN
MNKLLFVQIATAWLTIAVVVVAVMKSKSTITMAAEVSTLVASIALVMKFWVLKKQKKQFFMINARDLSITWSDNPKYWSWLPLTNEKTNDEVVEFAVLNKVCWLDVSGKFDTKNLRSGTKYEVVFVVKLEDTAYGWDWAPIKLKLVVPSSSETPQEHSVNFLEYIGKQWVDIPAGEFKMSKENVGEISFSLYEHEANMWRSGLIVKGVVIRPKYQV